jgi:hypothetical protein
MAATGKKLDLFKVVLPQIDLRNKDYYAALSADEKKEISPYVLMRFMSHVKQQNLVDHHLTMVNEIVNRDFSVFSKHPELQWKLLCLCGIGTKQFHPWIPPGKKQAKSKVQEALYSIYPNYKTDELELLESLLTLDEMTELFVAAGYSDKEVSDLCKTKK